jgi:Na+:H+ antiporter, NhaA family
MLPVQRKMAALKWRRGLAHNEQSPYVGASHEWRTQLTSRTGRMLRRFLEHETAGGLLLIAAAAVALVIAASPLAPYYFALLHAKVAGVTVQHWINDGLMAVFFLLVGLEIKREWLEGELSSWPRRTLPGIAAVGGMAVPAIVFVALNAGHPENWRGWAVPAATDIAFALGVLALLGSRVPVSLKVFLTALAVIDDIGAVIIIALFYAGDLSPLFLALAAGAFAVLCALSAMRVASLSLYVGVGLLLWYFVLNSGIHATVAGVLMALAIPIRLDQDRSPLKTIEHAISPLVAFAIVPIFGFANAGVSFSDLTASALLNPVTLGAAGGLFIGKQIGVFGAAWLAVKVGIAHLPAHASWLQLYGVALLCGIGFTMSLFIGALAFGDGLAQEASKIGVLAASFLSAIAGWCVLKAARTA